MGRRERKALLVLGLLFLVFGGKASARTPAKRRLSLAELEALARDAGFEDPVFAATIAMRESGGDPSVVNDTRGRTDLPPGHVQEFSCGLWQINTLAWPQYSCAELLDPKRNAQAAREIQRKHGWGPWSTARAPVPTPATPPEPIVTPGPPADVEPVVTPGPPAEEGSP